MRHHFWAGVIAFGSCIEPAHGQSRCDSTPPLTRVALDSTRTRALVGDFVVFEKNTIRGYDGAERVGQLRLRLNDSTSRFFVPTIGGPRRMGDRILTGAIAYGSYRDTVFSEGRELHFGCPSWMCTDASPTVLEIFVIDSTGFRGRWSNSQSGIGRIFDASGRALPNPEGFFCATRMRR
jgi:hypothetical protein